MAAADRAAAGGSAAEVVSEAVVYRRGPAEPTDLERVLRRVGEWHDGVVTVRWFRTEGEDGEDVAVTLVGRPHRNVLVYRAVRDAGGWVVLRHRPGKWEEHLRRTVDHGDAFTAAQAARQAGGRPAPKPPAPIDDAALFPDIADDAEAGR